MDPAAVLTEEQVHGALVVVKDRLQTLLGADIRKLVLYGSRARGDADPDSDVDVAIVVARLDPDGKRKALDVVADVELESGVPISALILSDFEYRRLLDRERRIALDIEREGVAL